WLVKLTLTIHDAGYTIHVTEKMQDAGYRIQDKNHESCIMNLESSSIALFSALIFVCHPIQTQAVTYIVQRFASLATFFYLLSLVMYIKFRIHDTRYTIQDKENHESCIMNRESCIVSYASWIMYLASLFSAVLAMKTKEIAFTLPLIITLYEFMFFNDSQFTIHDSRFKRILYLIPLLLTMLIIPLTLISIDKPAGELIDDISEITKGNTYLSRWEYLITEFRVIITYVRLTFLPINQNLDYDYPVYNSFLNPEVFLAFMVLLIFFAFGIYLFYASRVTHHALRLVAFGIFWFFITLFIESGIIPLSNVIFEHRVYLPGIGFIIAFSTATFYVLHFRANIPLVTYYLLLATPIIIFPPSTYQRNIIWMDSVSLWEDVVKKSPGKARGHYNLGLTYYGQRQQDKAIQEYKVAVRLMPDYPEAHYNLGNAFIDKGWIDEAIEQYKTVIRLMPDYAEAYNNLANAYDDKGWSDMAVEYYQTTVRLKPDYPTAHYNLGIAYEKKGLTDKAMIEYQTAVRLSPNYSDAHNNLGAVYERKQLPDEALKEYRIALRLNPTDTLARNNINRILRNRK
ncbi:MAG: tetratricopeptide repeat protein, partial [Nitrospirae bacterium]|nr:tetratricopeptide repeat protein [Nitrospirota bacterium]